MCAYILSPWEKQFSSSITEGLPNNIYEYVQWPWKHYWKVSMKTMRIQKKPEWNERKSRRHKRDINKETELLTPCQAEINFTWKPKK